MLKFGHPGCEAGEFYDTVPEACQAYCEGLLLDPGAVGPIVIEEFVELQAMDEMFAETVLVQMWDVHGYLNCDGTFNVTSKREVEPF